MVVMTSQGAQDLTLQRLPKFVFFSATTTITTIIIPLRLRLLRKISRVVIPHSELCCLVHAPLPLQLWPE